MLAFLIDGFVTRLTIGPIVTFARRLNAGMSKTGKER